MVAELSEKAQIGGLHPNNIGLCTYCQCQRCGSFRNERTAYQADTCEGFLGAGQKAWISHFAVQRGCEKKPFGTSPI